MNRLWIFGNASMICSFKLWRAKWNFSIFGTNSSIALRNLFIPWRSLKSSLAHSDGATHSQMDMVTVTSDFPSSPHQTTQPLQSDAGDHVPTFVQLSHSPNISSLNFRLDLVVSPSSCHMHFVPQPLSSYSTNPPNNTVSCSSILDSTLVVNEEQATNEVGVAQPTCTIIHEEYD